MTSSRRCETDVSLDNTLYMRVVFSHGSLMLIFRACLQSPVPLSCPMLTAAVITVHSLYARTHRALKHGLEAEILHAEEEKKAVQDRAAKWQADHEKVRPVVNPYWLAKGHNTERPVCICNGFAFYALEFQLLDTMSHTNLQRRARSPVEVRSESRARSAGRSRSRNEAGIDATGENGLWYVLFSLDVRSDVSAKTKFAVTACCCRGAQVEVN